MADEAKKAEAKAEPQVQNPVPEQQQGPDLTVQDLQAIKQIIDVASQRGAFRPNEMMAVGTTYNKLDAFLNAVAQQQGAPKGE